MFLRPAPLPSKSPLNNPIQKTPPMGWTELLIPNTKEPPKDAAVALS